MVKKIAVNFLRIALTFFFLFLVYRMIDFDDVREAVREDADGNKVVRVLEVGEEPLPGEELQIRDGILSLVKKMDKAPALVITALFLVPLTMLALRWWVLMRAAGVPAPVGRVICVSYAGAFFNLFFPGMVGGDIAKAVLATRGEERKTAIVGTVLLDRVIGLVVMVVMATVVLIPQIGHPKLLWPSVMILSLFGMFVLAYLVYFNPFLRRTGFGRRVKARMPFRGVVKELDDVLHRVKADKRALVWTCLLALGGQGITIILVYFLAKTIGLTYVPLEQFFLFEPILFILMAMPVSIGGWGVGEFAYAELFGLVGVPRNQAIAVSVLYKLALLLASLPGGILFWFAVSRRKNGSSGGNGEAPPAAE